MTKYLDMELSTYKSLMFNRKLTVVLNNKLSFGKGHLEAIILTESTGFRVLITDGYKYVYDKSGFRGLKQALNIAHGKMKSLGPKQWYIGMEEVEVLK